MTDQAGNRELEEAGAPVALGLFLAWFLPVAYLAAAIQAARLAGHKFRLTSWLRGAEQLPGGSADKSKHLVGWAADLVPLDRDNEAAWSGLAAQLRRWPGIWVLVHTGTGRHVHVQVGRYPLKQEKP